ncbi:MAG TPA: hypothetical protein VFT62_02780 [Mycobacteriales bacterium]|nr:hypothetical protein [Mycobacteriales bacterium]
MPDPSAAARRPLALVVDQAEAFTGWAARVVLDAEADRAQQAAALRELIEPALVAVRHAAERLARDPSLAAREETRGLTEAVRAALLALRQAQEDLRGFALEVGLRVALHQLAQQVAGDRQADGAPPLSVIVDAADRLLDSVPPAVAVTVHRVAQVALGGASRSAHVRATIADGGVKLTVESADIACDASELDRWVRRASALGGRLAVGLHGVELSLPVELALPDQREGSHDDGLDL